MVEIIGKIKKAFFHLILYAAVLFVIFRLTSEKFGYYPVVILISILLIHFYDKLISGKPVHKAIFSSLILAMALFILILITIDKIWFYSILVVVGILLLHWNLR